jgi:enoyl-CoA hydratase
MAMIRLDTTRDDGIAVLTLDRPPANALTREFFVELTALLPRLAGPGIRAVVVTGTGRFFSAGLDLFEVFSYPPDVFTDFTRRFDEGFAGLFALAKPLVAAVNGHAVAGGAVIAAAADLRLVAEGEGRTGLTELLLGIPFPTSVFEIVRTACDGPHLTEILYHGRTYLPADACTRRLVDEVVPAAELMPRAIAAATELGRREPAAFAATKRALRAEALVRIAAATAAGDPLWDVWRAPAARAAVEDYRTRTLGKSRRA